MADNRALNFTPSEMKRLQRCARSLGTSDAEFIQWAVTMACDELEAIGRLLANPVVGGESTFDPLWRPRREAG